MSKMWKIFGNLLVIGLFFISGCGGGGGGGTVAQNLAATAVEDDLPYATVVVKGPTESIQAAIDLVGSSGGTVFVRAGTYQLSEGLKINSSNITLMGETGTFIKLINEVNQPVILVGSPDQTPTTSISNIRISNIEIDGNRVGQSTETYPIKPWLRNNGIDVRKVRQIWIEGVVVNSCISGGLVISWDCIKVFISNSIFSKNRYDGIALYASRGVQVSNFQCLENDNAGISLDNKLFDTQFSNGRIENNKDVGIFARDSRDVVFHNLVISKNSSDGCFVSHQEINGAKVDGTGVYRLFFEGCTFIENGRNGFWLASQEADSPNNVLINSIFSKNASSSINLSPGAVLTQNGNIVQ